MKRIYVLLAVAAAMTALAVPAQAQGGDEARVRFRLHLYGDVPSDRSFSAAFFEGRSDDGVGVLFCREFAKTAGLPRCTGGEVYAGDLPAEGYRVEKGSSLRFSFMRWSGPALGAGGAEAFFKGVRTISSDTTIDAYYCFDGAREAVCKARQLPSSLPATGAGYAASVVPAPGAVPGLVARIHPALKGTRHRITFRLIINGEVPSTDDIGITVGYPGAMKLLDVVLCGPSAGSACLGGGTVYSRTVETAAGGSRLYYIYFAGDPRVDHHTIVFRETNVITSDTTITTTYDASAGSKGRIPRLPATGGGGMAQGLRPATIQTEPPI